MTNQPTPTNYQEALAVLNGKQSRKIANNTYLERFDPMFHDSVAAIGVRLHATYVVTFYADGTTVLNSGGWSSATTKERLNRYLPVASAIVQRNFEWYYLSNSVTAPVKPFADGIRILSSNGEFVSYDNAKVGV